MEIKEQLDSILGQIKESKEAATKEQEKFGTMLSETKEKLEALQKQADALDVKLAEKHAADAPDETVGEFLQKHEGVQKILRDKSGSCVIQLEGKLARQLERKTTIDSAAVGIATSGVLQIERTPGIVTEARRSLKIRGLINSRPTTLQAIDFVKVDSPLTTGSPQVETHTKKENAVTFTTVSERVRTFATWIPASRQILDDFVELEGFLRAGLPYYVDREEERQLLSGTGSGQDLNGLITQATAFSTALLPSASLGWNKFDVLARAVEQIGIADEVEPTFAVINPRDNADILLTKDSQGRYLFMDSDPYAKIGLSPVVTNAVASGTFLVGSGSAIATEIRDRMGMTVEIATQHEDYFARNMVAIRAEKRLALIVYRPGSFITGSFTTSP
jgi:HK97 family phage major capsid protein